jgi:hypothetical protein
VAQDIVTVGQERYPAKVYVTAGISSGFMRPEFLQASLNAPERNCAVERNAFAIKSYAPGGNG